MLVAGLVDDQIVMSALHPCPDPILLLVPLQFLAYCVAPERGCDVDQPRSLAKSVSVE